MRDGTGWRVIQPLRDFLAKEAAGGLAVVLGAVVALAWANSPWQASYFDLWSTELQIGIGSLALDLDLRHFVNEALMTVFFLLVGLEIKRELVEGELRDRQRRMLPLAAAIGGMAVPALIYLIVNAGGPFAHGWGIPMATDIALAVGALALLGSRVPAGLKLFLLALAIVDDVGAILVIALFYGGTGNRWWLLVVVVTVAVVLWAKWAGIEAISIYVVLGVILWFSLRAAGIHATLAGVALGLLAPAKPTRYELVEGTTDEIQTAADALRSSRMIRSSVSVVERLEYQLHGWSSYLIVPVFALANAGVQLSGDSVGGSLTSTVGLGVLVGLVVGKPLGILLASWIAVRLGIATLPAQTKWRGLAGAGALAGIGFTVSIFIAELALTDEALTEAKVAVLAASVLAGTVGLLLLAKSTTQREN